MLIISIKHILGNRTLNLEWRGMFFGVRSFDCCLNCAWPTLLLEIEAHPKCHGKSWHLIQVLTCWLSAKQVVKHPKIILLEILLEDHHVQAWHSPSAIMFHNSVSDVNGDILQLHSKPLKLLELSARKGEVIVCSTVSSDGTIIAFSDQDKIRVHKLTLVWTVAII